MVSNVTDEIWQNRPKSRGFRIYQRATSNVFIILTHSLIDLTKMYEKIIICREADHALVELCGIQV